MASTCPGMGGRVPTQVEPAVRVRATRLDKGSPVALRDTLSIFDLAIDFDQSPDDITAALAAVFREAIETGRWSRSRPPYGASGTTSPPATT